jgi:hypothetical protein
VHDVRAPAQGVEELERGPNRVPGRSRRARRIHLAARAQRVDAVGVDRRAVGVEGGVHEVGVGRGGLLLGGELEAGAGGEARARGRARVRERGRQRRVGVGVGVGVGARARETRETRETRERRRGVGAATAEASTRDARIIGSRAPMNDDDARERPPPGGSDADDDDDERDAARRAARAEAARASGVARALRRRRKTVGGGTSSVGRRKSSFDDARDARGRTNGSARARATRSFESDAEDEGARWGDGDGDASRKYALETRLRKMRALPKGSRYAKQQCELIEKALDILARGKRRGARSAEEEDELAGLLKAVKL